MEELTAEYRFLKPPFNSQDITKILGIQNREITWIFEALNISLIQMGKGNANQIHEFEFNILILYKEIRTIIKVIEEESLIINKKKAYILPAVIIGILIKLCEKEIDRSVKVFSSDLTRVYLKEVVLNFLEA